jgi:GMP synthase (glutamine-hydrolysing)
VSRVVFVVSEHRAGLTPERVARYARARRRLADVAAADVEAIQYADVGLLDADAVVLSGSYDPWALHDAASLDRLGDVLLAYDGPVLGICAGMQLQVQFLGGTIAHAPDRTAPGFTPVEIVDPSDVLGGLSGRIEVYAEHTDEVTALPDGLRILARSDRCAVEAFAAADRPWWGTQFHPELWTAAQPAGRAILASFFRLAGIPLRDVARPADGA